MNDHAASIVTGAELICDWLKDHDVAHLFGLPGSQNAVLYNALRRVHATGGTQVWVSSHEMSAGFTALGYAATTHRPAVLSIIGGPGFGFAITPLLEASADSIPLVCLVFVRRHRSGKLFQGQAIDHETLATAACKGVLRIGNSDTSDSYADDESSRHPRVVLNCAWELAQADQPGPVVVLIDAEFLEMSVASVAPTSTASHAMPRSRLLSADQAAGCLREELARPGRKLFWLGRGALLATNELRQLAETHRAVVITTTSARGAIAEDDPLCMPHDLVPAVTINQFIAEFQHIFAWGVRFSDNATKGFGLHLPVEKLVHVDAEPMALNANYPARVALHADVTQVAKLLTAVVTPSATSTAKTATFSAAASGTQTDVGADIDLAGWRDRFAAAHDTQLEPSVPGIDPPTPKSFFAMLGRVLGRKSILVLDSGFHQLLARRYYQVLRTHGLLLPSNYQSMGFALSAAMGAALAKPERRVVALIGDGGFRMSGLELLPAVVHSLPLLVVVFDDGFYGLIRNRQIYVDGRDHGVALPPLDYGEFAKSIGANFIDGTAHIEAALQEALALPGPTVVAIRLGERPSYRLVRYKARVRHWLRRWFR